MIQRTSRIFPAFALTAAILATSGTAALVAMPDGAEARTCRRVGFYPNQQVICEEMSTPRPDRPNQKQK